MASFPGRAEVSGGIFFHIPLALAFSLSPFLLSFFFTNSRRAYSMALWDDTCDCFFESRYTNLRAGGGREGGNLVLVCVCPRVELSRVESLC